jgi:lysophospholipase L1-like esterase
MKSILAFGDSLTWGFEAGAFKRHAHENRWPNALATGLKDARIVEEGMNGRTTVFPDPTCEAERNGAVALPILLTTHQPLDLVIIMLGTNDIKYANRCRAFDAAMGMERLIQIVKHFDWVSGDVPRPQVLIMSPPPLCETADPWFNDLWGHAIEESKLFATHYKRVADEQGVHFFDTGNVAKTDPTDGGHMSASETRKLGEALVPVVKKILEI